LNTFRKRVVCDYTGEYTVTDTISHVDPEIVLLTIDGETLETTAEQWHIAHPFYTSPGSGSRRATSKSAN
jgi:hypothetical protein